MAKIIRVEAIPGPPDEPWIAIQFDDGSYESRLLRPFELVPRVERDADAPPGDAANGPAAGGAASPDPNPPAPRVQFTLVRGGKRA